MSYYADRFVVILDANVLYPFRKRDILLNFYESGLFRARWTEEIFQEWRRSLLLSKPHLEKSIDSQINAIRKSPDFRDSFVVGYERLIPCLDLPDPKDNHVLAAAIRCGAQHIVTDNLKDFPFERTKEFDVEAISADEFLSRTLELYERQALLTLKTIREQYDDPTFTPSEFVMDLTAKGMPKLAATVKAMRDFL